MTARRSRTPGHRRPASPRSPSFRQELAALRARSALHDQQIHQLQHPPSEKATSWRQSALSLIPVLTFVFSLTTFLISAHWSENQTEREARAELRTLLQRLYQLDTREGEILASGDTASGELLNIYSEMGFLARQAMETTDRLGGGLSATEYGLVAQYLFRDGDNANASRMYEASIDAAATLSDYANARRAYGLFLIDTGDLEQGRAQFEMAVRADQAFPTADASYIAAQRADVEVAWAQAELAYGQCDAAEQHFRQADDLIAHNDGPSTTVWRQNLQQMMHGWEDKVRGCRAGRE